MLHLNYLPGWHNLDTILSKESINELSQYIEDKIRNTNDIQEIKNLIQKYLKIKIILCEKYTDKKTQTLYKSKINSSKIKKNQKKINTKNRKSDLRENNNQKLIDILKDNAIEILSKNI